MACSRKIGSLYFLDEFQRHCQYSQEMLDSNLAMDRGNITHISQLPGGESAIPQMLGEEEPLSVSRLAPASD